MPAAFEGLLEKAASEGKKGAGQYFTPRPLIQAIVQDITRLKRMEAMLSSTQEELAMAVAAKVRELRKVNEELEKEIRERNKIEKELLQRALRRTKGNKAKAARLVGLPRPRFLRRLQFFGIE